MQDYAKKEAGYFIDILLKYLMIVSINQKANKKMPIKFVRGLNPPKATHQSPNLIRKNHNSRNS